jgi:sugar lactone lactonase YvrE
MCRLPLILIACFAIASAFGQSAPSSDTHTFERIVPASAFHGVHGLAFDRNDVLHAGSVVGQSVYRIDASGAVTAIVGPPQGMADDLVFLADGTLVWTAISQGIVRARSPGGPVRDIAKIASINSINVRKTDGRLFAGQVFGGDGVWELDPTGVEPPRNIVKDVGGFNGFDIGPDGALYGPLWFKKQVVRIDPQSGALKVIADGFHTPAAANFDSKWNLYVLDSARGQVWRVDIASGAKQVVAQLATSLDNLAIDSKDRLFVSNMADNGIQEVNVRTGAARQVVKGLLAVPVSIASVTEGAQDSIYVADVFAFRRVDGGSGQVTDIARSHAADTPIEYPVSVTANARHVVLTNSEGLVQKFSHRSGKPAASWHLQGVQTALEMPDGSLIAVFSNGAIRNVALGAKDAGREIAGGLERPAGAALSGTQTLYVVEAGAGRITSVNLANGAKAVVASGLDAPRGIAMTKDGNLLTVELGARRLTQVAAADGTKRIVATDLPVGGANNPTSAAGVAVGANGAIYLSSDIENSIWRATPKRP